MRLKEYAAIQSREFVEKYDKIIPEGYRYLYSGTRKEKERRAYLKHIWIMYELFVIPQDKLDDLAERAELDDWDDYDFKDIEFPVPKNANRATQQLELEVFKEYLKEFDDLSDNERKALLARWHKALLACDLQEMIKGGEPVPHEVLVKAREKAKLMISAITAQRAKNALEI